MACFVAPSADGCILGLEFIEKYGIGIHVSMGELTGYDKKENIFDSIQSVKS